MERRSDPLRGLQFVERGAELLLFLQKLREPDAQLGGLRLNLGEAEGELPLLRGRLRGTAPLAVTVADVLQAAGGLLADALPVGLELLPAHVLPHALHLCVREKVGDDLRRALLEIFSHRRPSSCRCPAYCNPRRTQVAGRPRASRRWP